MKSPEKHKKIIRAATRVFAKKGFFHARISDIAKVAKVADGTIYLYFTNKFDILISIFEQEVEALTQQIKAEIAQEEAPQAQLRLFVTRHLEEMKKNRNLAEIIHIELRQANKLVREYRKNRFDQYLNIVADIIEKGQKENLFNQKISPHIAKQIIFGSLDELSRIWTVDNNLSLSVQELSEQLLMFVENGIRPLPPGQNQQNGSATMNPGEEQQSNLTQ